MYANEFYVKRNRQFARSERSFYSGLNVSAVKDGEIKLLITDEHQEVLGKYIDCQTSTENVVL